jgi:hypothetical protein
MKGTYAHLGLGRAIERVLSSRKKGEAVYSSIVRPQSHIPLDFFFFFERDCAELELPFRGVHARYQDLVNSKTHVRRREEGSVEKKKYGGGAIMIRQSSFIYSAVFYIGVKTEFAISSSCLRATWRQALVSMLLR